MAIAVKVEGLEKLVAKLRGMAAKSRKENTGSVVVGYTASYALAVHESVDMVLQGEPRPAPRRGSYWDPQGRAQAKFLEAPARMYRRVLYDVVKEAVRKGKTLMQGLLAAGLRLQRESQKLCPVETGNLKGSAFTRIE